MDDSGGTACPAAGREAGAATREWGRWRCASTGSSTGTSPSASASTAAVCQPARATPHPPTHRKPTHRKHPPTHLCLHWVHPAAGQQPIQALVQQQPVGLQGQWPASGGSCSSCCALWRRHACQPCQMAVAEGCLHLLLLFPRQRRACKALALAVPRVWSGVCRSSRRRGGGRGRRHRRGAQRIKAAVQTPQQARALALLASPVALPARIKRRCVLRSLRLRLLPLPLRHLRQQPGGHVDGGLAALPFQPAAHAVVAAAGDRSMGRRGEEPPC